ncbi:MAG: hypothetical protein IPJ98_06100 [Bryobacterales bacterium]|nr:hypothetical protein [Bryobacterales bacterium]
MQAALVARPVYLAPPRRLRARGLSGTQAGDITNVAVGTAGSLLSGGGSMKEKLVVSAPSIAGGILTAGGTSSIAATTWGTLAIPVIGAAVAGVTIGLTLLFARKGPKQKVATTKIVDQVEPLLEENLQGYLNGPRTRTAQEQAMQNFLAGWQFVVDHCNIPEMGDPGQRCVSERTRGGKWDWFALYYDPIANDAGVKADPGLTDQVSALFGGGASSLLSSKSPVLPVLALGLIGLALML